MSLITFNNVNYCYAQSNGVALNDISFSIEKGTYLAIAGKNGSGKSTLARLMCSLLSPNSGSVEIQGNTQIALVFQSPKEQIVSGIVYRDTAFGPQNLKLKSSEIELRTIESLNLVEMLHKAKSSTSALSLGQTQKIAFSGMAALFPEVLILDEAVSMLDPVSRGEIYAFLRYWHEKGNTIIHITHDREAIEEAEKTMVVSEGKIIFYDETKDFFKSNELQKNVFGKMESLRNQLSENKQEIDWNNKAVTFKFKNISFSYDSSNLEPELKDVSFDLYSGTLTALTGHSGSGKSTILELGCGLLEQSDGEILSEEKPVLALQNSSEALFEKFAVDDVAFGAINVGMEGQTLLSSVKNAMNKVNLSYDKFKNRFTFELSGGEQKRLAVAGILAMNRNILFFDEPTAGLDGDSRYAVLKMLRDLANEGKTVLFSTHKMDEVLVADREIHIEKGVVVNDTLELKASAVEHTETELKLQSSCTYAKTLQMLRNVTAVLSKNSEGKHHKVQKLPAWFRIVLFLLLFIFILCSQSLVPCMSMLLISVMYCIFCGFSIRKLISAGIKILPFLLFFCIFQMIFHPALENEIHFTDWKWFTVSPSKLFLCINSILRTEASMACISGFFISIPEYDLIDGLKILLKPLEILRIPVRYFILILEVLFRFIPLMVDQTAAIIKLQVIREGFKDESTKIKKIKAFIPLFVPLIIQTIKKSEALADAITMRCFK